MSSDDGNGDPGNVNDLFEAAHVEGVLSPAAYQTLTVIDLGAQIRAGLGVCVDDVQASEVVLLTMMPDDSGSIRFAGNEGAVRDGHNAVLDALKASKQRDGILAHTRYLNGSILFPYRAIDQAEKMTKQNYQAIGGTPLYDQSIVLLGGVLAKAQEFSLNGVVARSVTLIITDGADAGSVRRPKDVAAIVRDMLRSENHIIAGMGIADGSTDFVRVFRDMGIEDRWILTPTASSSDIRKAFQVFSQSAVRASQAAAFSKTALAGFVN
jgi:hypothetical protein